VYQELSQFARFDSDGGYRDDEGSGGGSFSVWVDSSAHSRSPLLVGADGHCHSPPMWTPRFSFRSSTLSVLKRYFRRLQQCVFKSSSSSAQTLPSRETPGALTRWVSYYWHRLASKKHAKELD